MESYATGADHDVDSYNTEIQQTSKLNLSKFLIQRQAAKEKAMKKAQSYRPELELCEVEESDSEKYLENFLSHIEDKDFMDDDNEKGT
ncbi:hypothetical protein PR048_026078 [Dryococelus australis]|uniref:Uncharacterized protein n=1 Tax=Dryococelus australis TaxID=614101 RepID=A0ABQ9GKD9_9NEOP|nr:hypothetical protein PR048_026078 [Dryococelus australis]